jgi:hypothetical protein
VFEYLNPNHTLPTKSKSTIASTQPEINIIYPLDSSNVQMKETVKGTATNIPEGQQLWIVTSWYDYYYPQNYVDIQSDGSWKLPVKIGEGDSDSTYLIIAVLADKNAQNEFNNYLNTFEKTGQYHDMRKLPDGAKSKVSVTVYRKPIPGLITASLNLGLGIINKFLIMENSSEILID